MQPQVSVIVPTMASSHRAQSLKRAIHSIRKSSRKPIHIIAVVNGPRKDPAVCAWLAAQSDVQVEFLETPSAPIAVRRGRELVTTPYFSTLDDDDEYLAGGTDVKLRLIEDSRADLTVTDGHRHIDGMDARFYWRIDRAFQDPLRALMSFGWLNGCNALYRTSSIDVGCFHDGHPFGEWTWLAFRLALAGKKIKVSEALTFRIYDTPGSLSKTDQYVDSYLGLFNRMLQSGAPMSINRMIRRRRSAFWHAASSAALERGDWIKAIALHLRSMSEVGGLRYLSFTRHFFLLRRKPNKRQEPEALEMPTGPSPLA